MRWESYLWNYMSLKNGFRKNLFLTKKLNVAPSIAIQQVTTLASFNEIDMQ